MAEDVYVVTQSSAGLFFYAAFDAGTLRVEVFTAHERNQNILSEVRVGAAAGRPVDVPAGMWMHLEHF